MGNGAREAQDVSPAATRVATGAAGLAMDGFEGSLSVQAKERTSAVIATPASLSRVGALAGDDGVEGVGVDRAAGNFAPHGVVIGYAEEGCARAHV